MVSQRVIRTLLVVTLLATALAIGLQTPAFASGCLDQCEWERDDCYLDAEDWWGQCYDVCEALYYPHDPQTQAECENDCDITRENDEDVCDTEYTICWLTCEP